MTILGMHTSIPSLLALVLCLTVGLTAAVSQPALAQEKSIAPEKNPPGDIPDSQVFVVYEAPQGFAMKAPEGWGRKDLPDGVVFTDKYGTIAVALKPLSRPLTAASVRANEAAELEKTGRAVKILAIADVKIPAGPAVRIVYSSNSDPNPVTNKQIRLENERYVIAHGEKVATLTLSAPQGADNADQWNLMARSFQWK